MRKKLKNEDGMTAVEASFIVPVVLIIIFLLMFLGFIMYQKTALYVIANDTAASIAQVYATPSKDPFVGYTDTKNLSQTDLYRNLTNAINKSVNEKNVTKANWFAQYRLASNRIYREKGDFKVYTTYETMPGTILQKIIVVRIEATYDLPFIRFFGAKNSEMNIVAEGRAQCMDMLDYSSTLSLFNTVANDLLDEAGEAVVKVGEIVDKIKDFSKNLF